LGRNPELRYTKNQKAVCSLNVAINSKEEETIWKRVKVWGRQAELCSLYLKKGHELFIRGEEVLHNFEDKQGQQRAYKEVSAQLIGFTNL
jgi:single-strand DNA-binding protein